jgi:hypothetical protein
MFLLLSIEYYEIAYCTEAFLSLDALEAYSHCSSSIAPIALVRWEEGGKDG